ncbi:MAG: glycosyltransferase [archaeon]
MNVSIILPTYNEKENLKVLIPMIEETFKDINHEVIIVDDSSPDGTADYINSLGNKNVKLLLRTKKEGIGAALRAGYFAANNEIILSSDSDLSFDVKDMIRLLDKLNEGYDLVVGTRHKQATYETKQLSTKLKYAISRSGNFVIKNLTGVDVTDFSANFRVMKKDVFDSIVLKEKTNPILLEMILKTKYKGYKVAEIPVMFKERMYGESKLNIYMESPKFFFKLLKMVFLYRILRWKH